MQMLSVTCPSWGKLKSALSSRTGRNRNYINHSMKSIRQR
nr:MAG TPA: hypothetical protein [Caudoviricetes sp.]